LICFSSGLFYSINHASKKKRSSDDDGEEDDEVIYYKCLYCDAEVEGKRLQRHQLCCANQEKAKRSKAVAEAEHKVTMAVLNAKEQYVSRFTAEMQSLHARRLSCTHEFHYDSVVHCVLCGLITERAEFGLDTLVNDDGAD
jgi:hypothetical protein